MSAARDPDAFRSERRRLLDLVPRRELWRAAILLAILAAILALRSRTSVIVKGMGEALHGPAGVRDARAPRVRLAPGTGAVPAAERSR